MSASLAPLLRQVRRLAGPPAASDADLLIRYARCGDEQAFTALVERHGPMVLRLGRRVLGDVHAAEDATQTAFLVLARRARSVRRPGALAAWLHRVALRIALKARAARRPQLAPDGRLDPADPRPDPLDRLTARELLDALDEEIARLPEVYRLPVLLCALEGVSQEEAARRLGWTPDSVRGRLERGRKRLHARLAKRGLTLPAVLAAAEVSRGAAAAGAAALARAVLARAADRAGATALADALCSGAALGKAKLAVLLALGATALGVALVACLAQGTVPAPPTQAVGVPDRPVPEAGAADRVDLHGDPLPEGAVARLGTWAFRHGTMVWDASLTFLPDGKRLVSAGGGWVRRWDLATGQADVNLGDGWRNGMPGTTLVTADGKLAHIGTNIALPGGGRGWECTEHDLETGKERTCRIEFPRNSRDPHGLPPFLSPDGKTFAELNYYGKLTLWNAADGTVTHQLAPQGGRYTALAFLPDGKSVLVGDDTHTFRAFDLAIGKERRSFGLLEGDVVARMAVSPDGKWLVTIGGKKGQLRDFLPHDRFLRLWDLAEGKEVRTLPITERSWVKSLVFAPDSRALLVGLIDQRRDGRDCVYSWDIASGKPGRAWTDEPAIGTTLAISPDGKVLATINDSGVIRFWDVRTGKERHPRAASPCGLLAVGFGPDGKTVLTAGADRVVRAWDARTGRPRGRPVPLEKGTPLTFWSRPRPLAGCIVRSEKGKVFSRLYDPRTGRLLLEQPGFSPVLSADGRLLATVGHDRRTIRIGDVRTGTVIRTLTPPQEKGRFGVTGSYPRGFTLDGRSLVVLGEGNLSVWDVESGKRQTSWSLLEKGVLQRPSEGKRLHWERVEAFAVSPDGSKVALSLVKDHPDKDNPRGWFGRVVLLETATGKPLHQTDLDDETCHALAFSPDGRRLAGGGRWTVRVWDVATGKEVGHFEGHRGQVTAVAFSPDGRRLASASEDSTALVWELGR
jgi:RNA polymerase sigma factor (sigma-70 family)